MGSFRYSTVFTSKLSDAVYAVYHSSKPGNITLYEDRLRTNIIGELSLKHFLKDNKVKKPVVRRAYTEVQEIDKVSYRSLCIITKMGEWHLPITAHIIPGVALLSYYIYYILSVRPFKNRLMSLILWVSTSSRTKRLPLLRWLWKKVRRIHRDMDHPDHTQMTTEYLRLGHKVDKIVELRISRIIQECQVCKNKSRSFSHGHGNK